MAGWTTKPRKFERVVEPVEQSFSVSFVSTVLCLSSVEPILDPNVPHRNLTAPRDPPEGIPFDRHLVQVCLENGIGGMTG